MTDILDFDEYEDEYEEYNDSDTNDESEAISGELVEFDEDFDLDNYEMNERQAREITDAILSAATAIYILVAQAHEHKAWKALGYSTWAEYVNAEFEMTARRSYQLIDLNKAIEQIESATPEGTKIKLTEAQARDLKRELPRITEELREETKDLSPEEAAARAEEYLEEQRAEIKEQKKAEDKAKKEKEQELEEAKEESYRAGIEAAADALLEADNPGDMTDIADDGFVDVEVEGSGENIGAEESMYLYNLFNFLESVSNFPEPEELIKLIPEGRVDEVTEKLNEVTPWINRFHTLWELREND